MSLEDLRVEIADWDIHKETLRSIRGKVFIEEQGVPQDIEWDEHDSTAVHFLITRNFIAVACGRMLEDGKIGRMAVLREMRGCGIGRLLLQHIIDFAKSRGLRRVYLHAQVHSSAFYHKCGFINKGEAFEEAGIAHQGMEMPLGYDGCNSFIRGLGYPEPFAQLALELALTANRRLYIYSPQLDHRVFDNRAMASALAALARRNRYSEAKILIIDSQRIVKLGHRLVTVARRLSSSIQIKKLTDHPELTEDTFMVRDFEGVIYQPGDSERKGFYEPRSRASAKRFIDQFEDLWNISHPDPELRVLRL